MIITTSWDDGHPLDIKLLELLEKYNLKATFYIPLSNPENPVMDQSLIKDISTYQDIGGHTLNHLYLNGLNEKEAQFEITQCKIKLEEIIGKPITAFCFPGGKYSNRDIALIKKAGFLFGRTTKLLSESEPNRHLMHTTVQAYNHSSTTLIKHCIKHFNFSSISKNSGFLSYDKNFLKLAEYNIQRYSETNQVFHIWGHSWEIEQFNLWKRLEDVFKIISSYNSITYLNNTETWEYIKRSNT
jgi:Predicted xylanase/chitin deacetylase